MAKISVLSERIAHNLELLWNYAGAWPDYTQAMRQALSFGRADSDPLGRGYSSLLELPGLCCQAAGGEPDRADDLALAWLLCYAAAHLMDSVQDEDELDAWWKEQGAGFALSAASGLYFSALLALNAVSRHPDTREKAAEVVGDFLRTLIVMGSGQHEDLTRPLLTLEQYWQQAETKSGSFFSLGCRAGARLATNDPAVLSGYTGFGRNFGLLIQITDDLEDVCSPVDCGAPGQKRSFRHSLPVVYALEVLPPEQADRLRRCLQDAPQSLEAAQEAISWVDRSGAADYILVEIERHKGIALSALEQAQPRSPAGGFLAKLVQDF